MLMMCCPRAGNYRRESPVGSTAGRAKSRPKAPTPLDGLVSGGLEGAGSVAAGLGPGLQHVKPAAIGAFDAAGGPDLEIDARMPQGTVPAVAGDRPAVGFDGLEGLA